MFSISLFIACGACLCHRPLWRSEDNLCELVLGRGLGIELNSLGLAAGVST